MAGGYSGLAGRNRVWENPKTGNGGGASVGFALDCRSAGAWGSRSRPDERLLHCRLRNQHTIGPPRRRSKRSPPCCVPVGRLSARAAHRIGYWRGRARRTYCWVRSFSVGRSKCRGDISSDSRHGTHECARHVALQDLAWLFHHDSLASSGPMRRAPISALSIEPRVRKTGQPATFSPVLKGASSGCPVLVRPVLVRRGNAARVKPRRNLVQEIAQPHPSRHVPC